MAELGALSLRIETVGDRQALRALDAIDSKARKADIGVEAATQALNKLGLSARSVGGSIQVADGQLEQATQIVRRLGSQATVTAGNLQQLGASSRQVVAAQTQSFQVLGRDVVQANGKITAFGKSGLNAFNALAFGMSQMAATGQMSFRSLATSMTSVLAFFGPHGAIAAAVIATGLVLVDFFKRQKKEVTELAALLDRFRTDATARRERDEPVTVSTERLAAVRRGIDANRKAMADLFDVQKRTVQLRDAIIVRPVDQQALARLTAERAQLLRDEYEALRQVNDAQATTTKELDKVKVATSAVIDVEKERQRAQAVELDALASLAKSRGTTAVELLRLIALEGDLTSELASGSVTKEREAEIWERITKARQTAAAALPSMSVRPLTPSTPQAVRPGELRMSASVAAQLDPNRIRQDVQNMDRAIAERAAAFTFAETQQALADSLGNALGSAITFGFAQGLGEGGIGEGFRQMTAQLASGLGSVAIDYGLKAIATSKLMAGISAFLVANPLLAIGAGIALVAFGRSIGGRGGGGGGGGGFAGGGSTNPTPISISRLITDPNADLRRRTATGLATQGPAAAASNPFAGVTFLVASTPKGREYLATQVGEYQSRGG